VSDDLWDKPWSYGLKPQCGTTSPGTTVTSAISCPLPTTFK
jgi:hypothetical protein